MDKILDYKAVLLSILLPDGKWYDVKNVQILNAHIEKSEIIEFDTAEGTTMRVRVPQVLAMAYQCGTLSATE